MELTIRPLQKEDYPALLSLWQKELGNRDLTMACMENTYARMAESDLYETWVALLAGKTVGFITTVRVLAVDSPRGYVKINGLAVSAPMQNKGIGTRLLCHVEKRAKETDAGYVGLASGVQRTGAHAFYESRGYDKGSWYFTKIPE